MKTQLKVCFTDRADRGSVLLTVTPNDSHFPIPRTGEFVLIEKLRYVVTQVSHNYKESGSFVVVVIVRKAGKVEQ